MRLSLLRRVPPAHLPGFRLTKRDKAIIQAVYEYRAMSTPHIEALFFAPAGKLTAPSPTRCHQRLKLLYHYGFLERREQLSSILDGRKPFVYFLADRGAELVSEQIGIVPERLDWRPSHNSVGEQHLGHLLATNDVRVGLSLAADLHSWMVPVWLDDKTLKSTQAKDYVYITGSKGSRRKVAIVPDGYFVLDILKPNKGHFFLEIDRRTETVSSRTWNRRDWVRRTQAYLAYHRSGAFTERYEGRNLRVLTVTTGEQRLLSMKGAAERAGGSDMFWFTTFDHAADPQQVLTEPVWRIAGTDGLFRLCE